MLYYISEAENIKAVEKPSADTHPPPHPHVVENKHHVWLQQQLFQIRCGYKNWANMHVKTLWAYRGRQQKPSLLVLSFVLLICNKTH